MEETIFRIREIMSRRKLPQHALADVLEITPAGVNKILKNKSTMSAGQLHKIAVFLNVDPNFLLGIETNNLGLEEMREPLFAYKSQINTIHAGGDVKTSIKDLNDCTREVEFLQAKLKSQEELIASLRSDLSTKQSLIDLLSSSRR